MSVALLLSNAGVVAVCLAVFAVLIAVIVFIHEYGHFSMARLCGVRVETFSIGFGRPLLKWTDRHGTEWRIAWIPLGGYVKFFGDADASSRPGDSVTEDAPATTQFNPPEKAGRGLTPEEKRVCFHFKPVWQRMLIVAAGPFANFALAIAIFWVLFATLGLTAAPPIIGEVTPGSAAEAAGFRPGDEIVSVDGRKVETFDDIAQTVILSSNETLTFVLRRDGREITVEATPRRSERDDGFGNKIRAGLLGIRSVDGQLIYKKFGPIEAFWRSIDRVGDILSGTVKFLGRLVQGKEDASQLSGP
ncbi:MAG: site-2 protease family protein, partial [Parvularculaceae bacterium]|nr:site-2 protease family protein [Parvularculaceae bacterium]